MSLTPHQTGSLRIVSDCAHLESVKLFFSQPWALLGNKWGIFSLQIIGPTRGSITSGKEIDQR